MSGKIKSENEDVLGHEIYVGQILDKITKNKPDFKDGSFVIGLEGEWGIGKSWILKRLIKELVKENEQNSKTSIWKSLKIWILSKIRKCLEEEKHGKSWILNRLKDRLEKEYKNNIIDLDSWTSFGYKYFIENYYKELMDKSLNPLQKLLDSSFKTLINELDSNTKFDKIPSIFGYTVLPIIYLGLNYIKQPIFSFFSRFGFNIQTDSLLAKFLIIILFLIIFISLKVFINHLLQEKSYNEIKKDIQNKISTKFKDKPLVVIIDDLDRSDPEEIKQIFKLVKSDANFANVIYILSYDRKIIEEKISKDKEKNRNDEANFFFDKIVQLHVPVLIPDREKLQDYFLKKINILVDSDSFNYQEKYKQDKYLEDVLFGTQSNFYGKLFNLFTNLRMVDKYMSCLEYQIQIKKYYIGFDICLGDLALIEFMRIFDSKLYDYIKNNQDKWLKNCSKLELKNNKNLYIFDDIKSTFLNNSGILQSYLGVITFCFKHSSNQDKLLGGKIKSEQNSYSEIETSNFQSYFSSVVFSDSQKTNVKEISELIASNEIDFKDFFEIKTKDIRFFRIFLEKNFKNISNIDKLVIPLLEYADNLKSNNQIRISEQREHIIILITKYYLHSPNKTPEFFDLLNSTSIATIAKLLSVYKESYKQFENSQIYKLSEDQWLEVGDKLHARFKKEWSEIFKLDNVDFINVLYSWKYLILETQVVELQKIIENEFRISDKKDSGYFQKDKFIKMLEKFGFPSTIYNIEKDEFKRVSNFGHYSYQRLNKFVSWDKIKQIIEKHSLYSEAEICRDFIDGWDNRDVDPFKRGWS